MRTLSSIIVDKDAESLAIIESYISRIDSLKLVGKFNNPMDAISFLYTNKVDLAFLDLETYYLNRIDIKNSINYISRSVFISKKTKPLIDTFSLNAIGQLLKPFSFSDFIMVVSKAKIQLTESSTLVNVSPAGPKYSTFQTETISVKTNFDDIKLNITDVNYIHSTKGFNKIYLRHSNKPITTTISRENILVNLPDYFLQVHNDFIINSCLIKTVQKRKIILENTHIPLGLLYQKKITQHLSCNYQTI